MQLSSLQQLPRSQERGVLNESRVGFPSPQSVFVLFAVRIMFGGKSPSLYDLSTINRGSTVDADINRLIQVFGGALTHSLECKQQIKLKAWERVYES